MKITLIYAAVISLALSASVPVTYANTIKQAGNFPRVVSFEEFPQGIRHWKNIRHTFQIEIPQQSKALSQLIIDIPSNLTVSNDINIFDQSDKKITVDVSINGKKVILGFPEPIAPGTMLTIEMKNVKKSSVTNGNKLYKFFGKFIDINTEIPIGIVRLRVY
ncbi:DUF2808 domain-containing protein [aff. Roholtiella sp. LEGE 12411]|uniref:DUF2808 domain-containing protein n=1 Tax=aff. Roholtiella sp. LEGE 12411 TaxID=1828822 RepID=UPI0018814D40|nr:DUF2808 domain-containing protein [aff. Roholtiella sp. LEGE 12411]MBE9034906.1 DUF2808 domain-containing protein [aff. Roholtiella sp. LEGE 12411]